MAVFFKNSDITIYNKFYDFATGYDMYQRTVINDVDWQGKRNATVANTGLLLADSIIIIVDKLENYVSPKQFAKLSDTERINYFTFAMADKIVKGEIDFEVSGVRPYRLADLESGFDNVVNVMSIRELSDHFEVEGK